MEFHNPCLPSGTYTNYVPVQEAELFEADSFIYRFKDACEQLDHIVEGTKCRLPELPLVAERRDEAAACYQQLSTLIAYEKDEGEIS